MEGSYDDDSISLDSFRKLDIGPLTFSMDEMEVFPINENPFANSKNVSNIDLLLDDENESNDAIKNEETTSTDNSPAKVTDFYSACFPDLLGEKEKKTQSPSPFAKSSSFNKCFQSSPPRVSYPTKTISPTKASKNSASKRRRGISLSSPTSGLPTLEETSSSEDDDQPSSDGVENEFKGARRGNDVLGPLISKKESPRKIHRNKNKEHRKPLNNSERIQAMQDKAGQLAGAGAEEEALAVYKKALYVTRKEVSRIKSQLSKVATMHPSTLESIHSRLHEDWIHVGVSIAKIRTFMVVIYERMGEYDKALNCCKEAQEVYRRQTKFVENNDVEGMLRIKEMLRQMEIMANKMKLAKESFVDRKSRHEEIILTRKKIKLTEDLGQRAKLYRAVEKMVESVREVEVYSLGEKHSQLVETDILASTLALEQNEYSKAFKYATQAFSLAELSLGMTHPRTGQVLLQMARISAAQQQNGNADEEDALNFYKKASKVFGESERYPLLVGSTLNEISVIHIRRREYEKAAKLLNESLEAYESIAIEEQNAEITSEKVHVWKNIGECHSHLKDHQNAVKAYLSALELQRSVRKKRCPDTSFDSSDSANSGGSEGDQADDENIADTLRRLGKLYVSMGNSQQALLMYKEALLIYRAAVVHAMKVTKGRSNPDLPAKQDRLAHCLFCIAEAQDANGNLDEAVRIFGESLQLRLFSDAHKQDKRSNMIHCAMCLSGIGNVHMKRNETDEALHVFKDAMSYCDAHGTCWKFDLNYFYDFAFPLYPHSLLLLPFVRCTE